MVLQKEDYTHVGPGWKPILEVLDQQISRILERSQTPNIFRVLQIKEKFGGLRFYFNTEGLSAEENRLLQAMVFFAEEMSFRMCEGCGRADVESRHQKNQKFGWIKTLCPDCHAFRDEGGRLWEKWETERKNGHD